MKQLIVIWIFVLSNFLFANDNNITIHEIDEYVSDIYYGNGIMTTKEEGSNKGDSNKGDSNKGDSNKGDRIKGTGYF